MILGARNLDQLKGNLDSLALTLSEGQLARLNTVSARDSGHFYELFQSKVQQGIFGGVQVKGW